MKKRVERSRLVYRTTGDVLGSITTWTERFVTAGPDPEFTCTKRPTRAGGTKSQEVQK